MVAAELKRVVVPKPRGSCPGSSRATLPRPRPASTFLIPAARPADDLADRQPRPTYWIQARQQKKVGPDPRVPGSGLSDDGFRPANSAPRGCDSFYYAAVALVRSTAVLAGVFQRIAGSRR